MQGLKTVLLKLAQLNLVCDAQSTSTFSPWIHEMSERDILVQKNFFLKLQIKGQKNKTLDFKHLLLYFLFQKVNRLLSDNAGCTKRSVPLLVKPTSKETQ